MARSLVVAAATAFDTAESVPQYRKYREDTGPIFPGSPLKHFQPFNRAYSSPCPPLRTPQRYPAQTRFLKRCPTRIRSRLQRQLQIVRPSGEALSAIRNRHRDFVFLVWKPSTSVKNLRAFVMSSTNVLVSLIRTVSPSKHPLGLRWEF